MKDRITLIFALVYLALATGCALLSDHHSAEAIVPALVWSYIIEDGRINSAYIEEGLAYLEIRVDGMSARVEAFDLADQQVQWVASEATNVPLLVGDGKLFLLNRDKGILSAISAEGGVAIWRIPLPAQGYEYELTFGDSILFFGVGDSIYAIDAADGRVLWQRATPLGFRINQAWLGTSTVYRDYDALSYHDGMLYIRLWEATRDRAREGLLLAMNALDGQEKWRLAFDVPAPQESPPWIVASRPTFDGRHLFFGDWIGRIYLMDKDTGEVVWQGQSEFLIAQPLLQDKRVYLPTRDSLLCLNSETGERLWSMPLPGLRIGSPIRATEDAVLFIADYWGERRTELMVVDVRTGELMDRLQISVVDECRGCVTSFEVDSGMVYATWGQTILAIDLSSSQ